MQYKKNGCFILKNSEEIDGEELRNSLPADLTNQWNRILLSSIDIDELDDEADMEATSQNFCDTYKRKSMPIPKLDEEKRQSTGDKSNG